MPTPLGTAMEEEETTASASFGPKLYRDPFGASVQPLAAEEITEHPPTETPASQAFQAVLMQLAAIHGDVVWRLKKEISSLQEDLAAKENSPGWNEQVPTVPAKALEEGRAVSIRLEETKHEACTAPRPTDLREKPERRTVLALREKLQMSAGDEVVESVTNTARELGLRAPIHNKRKQAELRSSAVLLKKNASNRQNSFHQARQEGNYGVTGQTVSMVCVAEHPLFNIISGVIIVVNALMMGIEVEVLTEAAETPLILTVANETCSLYFLFELILRLSAHRSDFFRGEGRGWNLFDTLLVILSIVDFLGGLLFGSSALKIMQGFKTLKMLRIARLFRVVRFFQQLYLLVSMIIDSFKQLLWATVLLIIVIYVFAVVLTGNCSSFLQSLPIQEVDNLNFTVTSAAWSETYLGPLAPMRVEELEAHYGHLHLSVYTLFQTLLGGVSWRDVCNPLFQVDVFSPILFLTYVTFVMIAVLNIITGVFVDNAMESAKADRTYLIEQEIVMKENYVTQLKKFFDALDIDGDGDIDIHEVLAIINDPALAAYLRVLGMEVDDAERLFRLLDTDQSGSVNLSEFLEGCMRLKGTARSLDMFAVLTESRQTRAKLDELVKLLTQRTSLS